MEKAKRGVIGKGREVPGDTKREGEGEGEKTTVITIGTCAGETVEFTSGPFQTWAVAS
jgi:hypothetical protein